MTDAEGISGASVTSVRALAFFEPPRLRAGLMANADTDSGSDDISTTGPDVDTFPADASGNTACSAILAAND